MQSKKPKKEQKHFYKKIHVIKPQNCPNVEIAELLIKEMLISMRFADLLCFGGTEQCFL